MYTKMVAVRQSNKDIYFLDGEKIIASSTQLQNLPLIPQNWLRSFHALPEKIELKWDERSNEPIVQNNEVIIVN